MAIKITALVQWLACRSRSKPLTTVVLHATAGRGIAGALSTLRAKGFSYHYLVARDGSVTKCVPASKVAYHAGVSQGPNGSNVNGYSIGISMENRNDGLDDYPEAQVRACAALVSEISTAYPSVMWITTHYAISPGRKTDPRGFPVEKVAGRLKLWKGKN